MAKFVSERHEMPSHDAVGVETKSPAQEGKSDAAIHGSVVGAVLVIALTAGALCVVAYAFGVGGTT